MASTLISAQLPPDIDPTKARLAYGERALPKLVSLYTRYFALFYYFKTFTELQNIMPMQFMICATPIT